MDQLKPPLSANRYYAILGLNSDASPCAIRAAYKKLAMKWHPDKCNIKDRAEAKIKFQEIQEAYAVLSDERKRTLYDSGLYDPDDDDKDIEDLSSFLNEMAGMMANVQASEDAAKGSSFEDLQQLFVSMFSADLAAFNNPCPPSASSINFDKKRGWGGSDYDTSYFGSCIIEESFSLPPTHYFFNDAFHFESNTNTSSSKKSKCVANGLNSSACVDGFSNIGSKGMAGLHTNMCSNGLKNGFHVNTHDNGYDDAAK